MTRAQLTALDLGRTGIDSRLRAGHLHRVHRGVYAVGHQRLTPRGRFLAAVVALGPEAALSHLSAAILWSLRPERGPRVDVTVPRGGQRSRRRLVVVHRAALPPGDVTVKHGISVTTPARTLVDLADVVSRRELERAMDEAAYLRLDLSGLRPRPGRRAGALLTRLLAEHHPGTTRTRSEMEERMLALCRRFGLPQPRCNVRIEGHTADFVWPDHRLIVETDGWEAHGTRAAFERDRRRDADLTTAGWRVVRLTWSRLTNEPEAVAAQLERLLELG